MGGFGPSLLQGKQYSLLTRVFLYYIPSLLSCWIFLMSSFSEVNSESFVKDKLNIWKASGIKLREASHSFRILGGVRWKKPERAYNSSILGFNSDQYITVIYYGCAETVLWLNRKENSYWLAMAAIGIAILSDNVHPDLVPTPPLYRCGNRGSQIPKQHVPTLIGAKLWQEPHHLSTRNRFKIRLQTSWFSILYLFHSSPLIFPLQTCSTKSVIFSNKNTVPIL